MEVDASEIHQVLNSIGLNSELVLDRRDGALTVDIPYFRPDIEREIDLISRKWPGCSATNAFR
jgi:phenylalanyl-tRNA synthetase beta subunit